MSTQYIPTDKGWEWFGRVSLAEFSSGNTNPDIDTDLTIFEIIEFDNPITFQGIMDGRFRHGMHVPYKAEVVRRSLRRLFEFGYISQVDDNDEYI